VAARFLFVLEARPPSARARGRLAATADRPGQAIGETVAEAAERREREDVQADLDQEQVSGVGDMDPRSSEPSRTAP